MKTKVTIPNNNQVFPSVTVSNRPQVITVNTKSVSESLSNLFDVNLNNATDGAVLQYDVASNTWIAENALEKSGLQINCGNF